jgi:hypothetical protein
MALLIKTCAVVDSTGLVVNIIVADPNDKRIKLDEGHILVPYPDIDGNVAAIGYTWDGTHFINPNPLPPPDPLPPPPPLPTDN